MKRLFLSILVSAVCSTMQAAEVNQKKAQETAKAFMTRIIASDEQAGTRAHEDKISLKTVETGLKGLHVFNMDGGNGFGIGLYNGEELEKVYVAARNLEFANESYIDNIDVSLNFGEGMADGLYQLYGVSKLHDATDYLQGYRH